MKQLKTLFLITVISLIAITVNATTVDTNSTSTVVKTDSITALTFNKVYEDVKEGIQGLAVALKAPAEHVYGVMIKQQIVNAWGGLIFIIVMLVLLFLSIQYLRACNSNEDLKDLTEPAILLIVVLIATFVTLIVIGPDILTGFLNPEYGAIQQIMYMVK